MFVKDGFLYLIVAKHKLTVHDTKKLHFYSTLTREKGPGTGTLSTCSREKALCHRRTVTGVPSLNTVQGLWKNMESAG
jgi:hypothetical protein